MNTAVQVGLLGKFQSCPSTNSLQHIRTLSSRRVVTPQSSSRNLFGKAENVDEYFEKFNEESKKYLEDTYGYTTAKSKDEKSSCNSSSICHHPNLIELERKEYESKMKNSKITSKSYWNIFFPAKI